MNQEGPGAQLQAAGTTCHTARAPATPCRNSAVDRACLYPARLTLVEPRARLPAVLGVGYDVAAACGDSATAGDLSTTGWVQACAPYRPIAHRAVLRARVGVACLHVLKGRAFAATTKTCTNHGARAHVGAVTSCAHHTPNRARAPRAPARDVAIYWAAVHAALEHL